MATLSKKKAMESSSKVTNNAKDSKDKEIPDQISLNKWLQARRAEVLKEKKAKSKLFANENGNSFSFGFSVDQQQNEDEENTEANTEQKKTESQFEKEVQWCIQQLKLGLLQKHDEEQEKESLKVMRKLEKKATTPQQIASKRHLMRVVFGDYKKLMVRPDDLKKANKKKKKKKKKNNEKNLIDNLVDTYIQTSQLGNEKTQNENLKVEEVKEEINNVADKNTNCNDNRENVLRVDSNIKNLIEEQNFKNDCEDINNESNPELIKMEESGIENKESCNSGVSKTRKNVEDKSEKITSEKVIVQENNVDFRKAVEKKKDPINTKSINANPKEPLSSKQNNEFKYDLMQSQNLVRSELLNPLVKIFQSDLESPEKKTLEIGSGSGFYFACVHNFVAIVEKEDLVPMCKKMFHCSVNYNLYKFKFESILEYLKSNEMCKSHIVALFFQKFVPKAYHSVFLSLCFDALSLNGKFLISISSIDNNSEVFSSYWYNLTLQEIGFSLLSMHCNNNDNNTFYLCQK